MLGTWFGAGLAPPLRSGLAIASTVLLVVAIHPHWRWPLLPGLWSIVTIAGVIVGRDWAHLTGIPDDGRIAIDEVAGVLLACLPVLRRGPAVLLVAGGLFAIVDKLKPWPVSLLETELPWSLGVVLDDVAAGLVVAGLLASALAASARWRTPAVEQSDMSAKERSS